MKVGLALVGAGAMAEYHCRKFSAIPGVSVLACADRRESKAESFATRFGIPYRYDRIEDLLATSEADGFAAAPRARVEPDQVRCGIDAACCAVVDSQHSRIALACLRRGLPLFCEKPLARSLAEAEVMASYTSSPSSADADVRAQAQAGKDEEPGRPLRTAPPVVINFSKRNAPALVALTDVVRGGKLGRILDIEASYRQGWLLTGAWGDWRNSTTRRWRLSPTESTAGVLGDLGSHLIDAILALTGGAIVDPVLVDPLSFREAYTRGLLGPALPDDDSDPLVSGNGDAEQSTDAGSGTECPSLVAFSALARLDSGARVHIMATWIDREATDAFAIRVRGELGTAFLNLDESRSRIKLATPASEEWIEGESLPSTYMTFIDLVQIWKRCQDRYPDEAADGRTSRVGGSALPSAGPESRPRPDWMRGWSSPSFTEGLAVQVILESLMEQTRIRYGTRE